jgi:peptidyl-prolyl cis-trans isomerase A (cyclophilin A)
MQRLSSVFVFACALAAAAGAAAAEPPADSAAAPAVAAPHSLPEGFAEGWYAKIETSLGTIVARLLPEQAPQGVAHFAAFAAGRMTWTDIMTGSEKTGPFYDGLAIHKVASAERFEAGDPTGTGRGAPLVYVPIEVGGPFNFDRPYRIGLTRSGGAKVNGAMFFVTRTSQPFLTHRHPCIAEVVAGREVVDAICTVKSSPEGKPLATIVIDRIRILKVGDPPPIPDPVAFTPKVPTFDVRPR